MITQTSKLKHNAPLRRLDFVSATQIDGTPVTKVT